MFYNSTLDFSSQLDILREWARSEDGRNVYEQLTTDVQYTQNVAQLGLDMVAIVNYRRLYPDFNDPSDKPILASYLEDQDAHFQGHSLGNSGRVAEHMVFALLRVLYSFGDQYRDLTTFVETVLDRDPPLLHSLAGLSDQYLRWRLDVRNHKTESDYVMIPHFDALAPKEYCSDSTLPVTKKKYVHAVLNLHACLY